MRRASGGSLSASALVQRLGSHFEAPRLPLSESEDDELFSDSVSDAVSSSVASSSLLLPFSQKRDACTTSDRSHQQKCIQHIWDKNQGLNRSAKFERCGGERSVLHRIKRSALTMTAICVSATQD